MLPSNIWSVESEICSNKIMNTVQDFVTYSYHINFGVKGKNSRVDFVINLRLHTWMLRDPTQGIISLCMIWRHVYTRPWSLILLWCSDRF